MTRYFVRYFTLFVLLAASVWGQTVLNTVPVPSTTAAFNPVTNKMYFANQTGGLMVYDAASGRTRNIALPGNANSISNVAVNPQTNQVFLANRIGLTAPTLIVVDGTTSAATSVNLPAGTVGSVTVNAGVNKAYLLSGTGIVVVDGKTHGVTTVSLPDAQSVGSFVVDAVRGRNWVSNAHGVLYEMDGKTNVLSQIKLPVNGTAVCIDDDANVLYVDPAAGQQELLAVDGETQAVSSIPLLEAPATCTANPATHDVYVTHPYGIAPADDSLIEVIDGVTKTASTLQVGTGRHAIAIVVHPPKLDTEGLGFS